jgi:hypothetical protein
MGPLMVHLLMVDPGMVNPLMVNPSMVHPSMVDRRMFIVDPSMVDPLMVHLSMVDACMVHLLTVMVQCRLTNRKSLGAHKLPNGYRVTKGEDPSCCASRDAASQL